MTGTLHGESCVALRPADALFITSARQPLSAWIRHRRRVGGAKTPRRPVRRLADTNRATAETAGSALLEISRQAEAALCDR